MAWSLSTWPGRRRGRVAVGVAASLSRWTRRCQGGRVVVEAAPLLLRWPRVVEVSAWSSTWCGRRRHRGRGQVVVDVALASSSFLRPPLSLLPLRVVLHSAGPHPSGEGRGTVGLEFHGGERVAGELAMVLVELEEVERPKSSTIDGVDVD